MEILLEENSKYNLPECLKFNITNENALKTLIQKYKDLCFIPNFIYRILKDMPHRHREGIRIHPKMYSFGILKNNEPEFILIPNSPKNNHDLLMSNPKNAKNSQQGLVLVGYYIHQDQIKDSVFSKENDRKKLSDGDCSFLKIIEKEYLRTGTPEERTTIPRNNSFTYELDRIDNQKITDPQYLVTIADLNSNHIPFLKQAKKHIQKQLEEIYDVDFKTDNIEIFFHFPTSIETSTLHIHVRVNTLPPHKTEIGVRYYLEEVIQELEKNGNLYRLILLRNPNYTSIEFNYKILENIDGIECKIIQNPFSIFSDKIHETSKKEFDTFGDTLNCFFSIKEIEYLYSFEKNYKYIHITKNMLSKYLDNDTVELILQNKSFFFDFNDRRKLRGRFETQFADKFLELMKKKNLFKKTVFIYKNITSKINNYEASFADDLDYLSGFMTCVGEISNDCESLGKHGTNYIFFDMLSEDSRRFFIKKDGKIIGQSLVFIDYKKEDLIISSLACLQSIDYKVTRTLIENFAISLLKANSNIKRVSIGVGGRNFVIMDSEDMPKIWPKTITEQTKTWQAWQRFRRNPNPDYKDVLLCSKSIGYPIDLKSNISIRIQDEKLYHMIPKERWDSYRVATIVDRENIITKEILNEQQIKNQIENVSSKTKSFLISIDNNQAKHTKRQIEFMELVQNLVRETLKCCCSIEVTKVQSGNKQYSSFIIESLNEIEKKNLKEIMINIFGGEQIAFHDLPIIIQDDGTYKKNDSGLVFSVKIDTLGFSGKNIVDKLKNFLIISKVKK